MSSPSLFLIGIPKTGWETTWLPHPTLPFSHPKLTFTTPKTSLNGSVCLSPSSFEKRIPRLIAHLHIEVHDLVADGIKAASALASALAAMWLGLSRWRCMVLSGYEPPELGFLGLYLYTYNQSRGGKNEEQRAVLKGSPLRRKGNSIPNKKTYQTFIGCHKKNMHSNIKSEPNPKPISGSQKNPQRDMEPPGT